MCPLHSAAAQAAHTTAATVTIHLKVVQVVLSIMSANALTSAAMTGAAAHAAHATDTTITIYLRMGTRLDQGA